MMLNTTMILDLLRQQPERYIQHSMGRYCMKEANGVDVIVEKTGGIFSLSRQPRRWTTLRTLRGWSVMVRNTPPRPNAQSRCCIIQADCVKTHSRNDFVEYFSAAARFVALNSIYVSCLLKFHLDIPKDGKSMLSKFFGIVFSHSLQDFCAANLSQFDQRLTCCKNLARMS